MGGREGTRYGRERRYAALVFNLDVAGIGKIVFKLINFLFYNIMK